VFLNPPLVWPKPIKPGTSVKSRAAYFRDYYQKRVKALRAAPIIGRPCPVCGKVYKGRSDKRYCSPRCRVKDWRTSRA
jgi:uncharacterized OB-fold protein